MSNCWRQENETLFALGPINMALVNGGFLHYTDMEKFLKNLVLRRVQYWVFWDSWIPRWLTKWHGSMIFCNTHKLPSLNGFHSCIFLIVTSGESKIGISATRIPRWPTKWLHVDAIFFCGAKCLCQTVLVRFFFFPQFK